LSPKTTQNHNFAALFTKTVGGVRWYWYVYIRKQKINEIPAVSSEMSFDGRSLTRPHESPHILYIFRN